MSARPQQAVAPLAAVTSTGGEVGPGVKGNGVKAPVGPTATTLPWLRQAAAQVLTERARWLAAA